MCTNLAKLISIYYFIIIFLAIVVVVIIVVVVVVIGTVGNVDQKLGHQ